ncbi:MAG: TraR/DksA family transcriptional regulator [Bryobacteraceae bacterium]
MERMKTLTTMDMKRRRTALERKLRELTTNAGLTDELRIETLADPMDLVQTKTDRDIAVAELDYRAAMMRDVRSAMEKMAKSAYGICEECEESISPKRLNAVPWARLCIKCQSEAERHGGHEESTRFDQAA